MDKIRRAAEVVEILKTLGVLKNEEISCYLGLEKGIVVTIWVPKSDVNKYTMVKYTFEQEFGNSVNTIEDNEALMFLIY